MIKDDADQFFFIGDKIDDGKYLTYFKNNINRLTEGENQDNEKENMESENEVDLTVDQLHELIELIFLAIRHNDGKMFAKHLSVLSLFFSKKEKIEKEFINIVIESKILTFIAKSINTSPVGVGDYIIYFIDFMINFSYHSETVSVIFDELNKLEHINVLISYYQCDPHYFVPIVSFMYNSAVNLKGITFFNGVSYFNFRNIFVRNSDNIIGFMMSFLFINLFRTSGAFFIDSLTDFINSIATLIIENPRSTLNLVWAFYFMFENVFDEYFSQLKIAEETNGYEDEFIKKRKEKIMSTISKIMESEMLGRMIEFLLHDEDPFYNKVGLHIITLIALNPFGKGCNVVQGINYDTIKEMLVAYDSDVSLISLTFLTNYVSSSRSALDDVNSRGYFENVTDVLFHGPFENRKYACFFFCSIINRGIIKYLRIIATEDILSTFIEVLQNYHQFDLSAEILEALILLTEQFPNSIYIMNHIPGFDDSIDTLLHDSPEYVPGYPEFEYYLYQKLHLFISSLSEKMNDGINSDSSEESYSDQ